MYLHLGADCMIKNTDIIAIFNIRDQQSEIYDNYISVNKDKYKIIDLFVINSRKFMIIIFL